MPPNSDVANVKLNMEALLRALNHDDQPYPASSAGGPTSAAPATHVLSSDSSILQVCYV